MIDTRAPEMNPYTVRKEKTGGLFFDPTFGLFYEDTRIRQIEDMTTTEAHELAHLLNCAYQLGYAANCHESVYEHPATT